MLCWYIFWLLPLTEALENRIGNICPKLFELEIPKLVCGYLLWPSLWMLIKVLEKSCPDLIYCNTWGKNHKVMRGYIFGPRSVPCWFCDLDLWPHFWKHRFKMVCARLSTSFPQMSWCYRLRKLKSLLLHGRSLKTLSEGFCRFTSSTLFTKGRTKQTSLERQSDLRGPVFEGAAF